MDTQQTRTANERLENNYREALHRAFHEYGRSARRLNLTGDSGADQLLSMAMANKMHIKVYEISPHTTGYGTNPASAGRVSRRRQGK